MIIAIEGGDQAGKLTQSRMLARALRSRGHGAKLFHFPDYTTPIGREIKRLLGGRHTPEPRLIHCLLAANRLERLGRISNCREPVLVMNRYYHSNIAYGMANGLDRRWLEGLDEGMPRPDMVILLDVTQPESFRRQKSRRDRFERDAAFIRKVSTIYRRLAKAGRWKIIDASLPIQEVHKSILGAVLGRIK